MRTAPARDLPPANGLLGAPGALRARLDEDGFLFFRALLPRDAVAAVRREILECCRAGGWLVPGPPLLDGIADPARACVEPEPEFLAVYRAIQRGEAFHALAHDPVLIDLVERVLDGPALPHPNKIARLSFPGNVRHTTPPHQDFPFIQGTARTYTTWIPLGDVPRALGGLEVNRGSHRTGVHAHHISMGAGGMAIRPDELTDAWHAADYGVGDVLLFHSHTVHRASPNRTRDRLRLSVDYRYQARTEPISEKNLHPHTGALTWEEVYRGWTGTDLRYYWQRADVTVVGYDTGYFAHRDQEAFDAAARGEAVARPALLRIAQRDPDPGKRARAAEVLAVLERRLAGAAAASPPPAGDR